MSTNQIGLEKAELTPVIKALNALLSSYHLFYINVRGYHWNVKGEHFLPCTQNLKSCTPSYNYKLTKSLNAF